MFQFQVLIKEDKRHVWRSVRPAGGQPYEYATYDEAYRQMEMCYPDEILGETVRVIETQNHAYQPKTGAKCSCRRGIERDNCPRCEGTGMVIDFAAIRAR